MQELQPFQSKQALISALDNGGRFYNLMSKAKDNVISKAELAKAAGTFSGGQSAFLFFGMASSELPEAERQAVFQMMDADLQRSGRDLMPSMMRPSQVESQGEAGRSAIISGYPRFVEDRTQYSGFIMVPMTVDNVTTFIMVPIFDQYDVWEIFDDHRFEEQNSVIATTRGTKFTPGVPIRFGGVLRELKFEDKLPDRAEQPDRPDQPERPSVYLETLYYTVIQAQR